jgi:hypothetical protein
VCLLQPLIPSTERQNPRVDVPAQAWLSQARKRNPLRVRSEAISLSVFSAELLRAAESCFVFCIADAVGLNFCSCSTAAPLSNAGVVA